MIRNAVDSASLFGWLEKIPYWDKLRYPIKGGLLRFLKAGLAAVISYFIAQAAAGTLYPPEWSLYVTGLLTAGLQAADKYIREWNIEEGNSDTEPMVHEELPETDTTVSDAT